MKKLTKNLITLFFIVAFTGALGANCASSVVKASKDPAITLADPTIFYHMGIYYLYGTGGDKQTNQGFVVYTSPDLKNWTGPVGASEGYALKKGDAFGDKGFWAPQVFFYNNLFYMAYTANEHIAIAASSSPLGPFNNRKKSRLLKRKKILILLFLWMMMERNTCIMLS